MSLHGLWAYRLDFRGISAGLHYGTKKDYSTKLGLGAVTSKNMYPILHDQGENICLKKIYFAMPDNCVHKYCTINFNFKKQQH